ncbi:recombinase family protein [Methylotenera sp. L2L1]|uniref:recombinase family protein n=1 Tax=Methylotenera sp. L2L1 TaxID=1502770 RepID=UPI00055DBDA8|nr:recombinase family protein [Methylotenera sp. L2L1]
MTSKHSGQLVGYIRVSTVDQNTSRQEEQLQGFNLDEVFIDKASGKDTARPQLQAALKHLRKGDTLIVHSMDRLARNLTDMKAIVRELNDKGVGVQFVKENMTFTGDESSLSKLMLNILGSFAEFERELIKERQREGIAIAKAKGAYAGRKPTLSDARVTELLAKDKENGNKNRAALAREYGISRETLYQYLKAGDVSLTSKSA